MASPAPVFAANECGDPVGDEVTCTATGNNYTDGIAYTVDDLTIILEGDVIVETDANGEHGVSSAAAGALTVDAYAGSTISTAGIGADGVYAYSTGGPVTVSVAGVTTEGDYAEGVRTRSDGAGDDGAVSVTATGTISTAGYASYGVFATSPSSGPVTVRVAGVTTGGIDDQGNRLGDYSEGVYARSYGDGDNGAVSVTATGTISTAGDYAEGVYGYSAGGPVTVNVAAVTTGGYEADGVDARSYGSGDYGAVTVTATGPISTAGYQAEGVLAISSGTVMVSVAGVTTGGYDAEGVYARSYGFGADGSVTVTATGPISTAGYQAEGVLAISSGTVMVSVAGVTTGGFGAEGVYARTDGSGADGAVSVTATGDISTAGYWAEGVYGYSAGGPVTVNVAAVTTGGYQADGVDARSYGSGADGSVTVTATGPISTAGDRARGVYARSDGGPVTVSVTAVTTGGVDGDGTGMGDYADGVRVRTEGSGADGAVSVTATGDISTAGEPFEYDYNSFDAAEGVWARSDGGTVTVSVAGVNTAGDLADGVFARSGGVGADGAVSVTVTGAVTTTGADADGVYVRGASSHIVITETGSVGSDQGYALYSYGAAPDDGDVFGGLSGYSQLNAGDDDVTFFATADISGIDEVDAGDGADALTFDGLVAEIDADEFVNFETATFTNGASIFSNGPGPSLLSAPDGVFIINGSTLRLGDEDDILGSVFVEAGSTLQAYGDSPGMNTITGDLTLAGLLDLTDDGADDRTDVTGALDGQGGTIALDVSFGRGGPVDADLVTFGGDLTGMAYVDVNPVADGGPAGASPPLITFGGSPLADIDLVDGYLPVDGLVYGLVSDGDSYFLVWEGSVAEEVAGAMALGAALPALNRGLFADLGARIGTGDALRRPGMVDGGNALWARLGRTRHEGDVGERRTFTDFDLDQFYAQIGVDAFRAETGKGAIVGAVMAQYGTASGNAHQPRFGPSAEFDVTSYGFGLGATWYVGTGETYVDLTGMVNWHDIDVASEDTDAVSYTVGLEAGTRIPAGAGSAIAPMAQLVYSHTDVDEIDLPSAVNRPGDIDLEDPESLEARALAMFELDAGMGSVQFGGGFAYELLGNGDVDFGYGYSVGIDTSGASGEVAVRARLQVSEGVTVFGDLTGRKGLSGNTLDSYGGMLGIKIDF